MPSLPVSRPGHRKAQHYLLVPAVLLALLVPVAVRAQGNGRSSTGTGGSHVIQGYIFFPSGRRADGTIQVKLQSLNSGELSLLADNSGEFTFTELAPGNYTVVVLAGDNYEIARESVSIDSDLNLSRVGIPVIKTTRHYTVMVNLQLKSANNARASVVNAALAGVPQNARVLYEKGLELAKAGETLKAIDSFRSAILMFPDFPLALNELGVQYLKLGQASKAVEPLRSASKLSPDAFTPKLNLGIALLETQQYADAERPLRETLKLTSAPTAHMYLGLTLAHLHNDAEAEKEFKSAIDSSGNQLGLAHYYLGGLYWRRSEFRLAADELEAYLRLAPNAQDAEKIRGTIKTLRAKSS